MRGSVFVALIAILLGGCHSSDYDGYTRLEKSIHYKILELGDETSPISQNAFISFQVELQDTLGSVLGIKRFNRIPFAELKLDGCIADYLLKSHAEEHFIIMGRVDELQLDDWLGNFQIAEEVVRLEFTINEALNSEALIQKRAEERMLKDFEVQGQRALNAVLDSLNLGEANLYEGIYFKTISEGSGLAIETGDYVTTHYITRLASGKILDDTHVDEPLEYQVGKPDQVIHGFAIGVSNMSVGEKAVFVIPSELAFGEKGSSSGLVPPFSALVYEVELVEARK